MGNIDNNFKKTYNWTILESVQRERKDMLVDEEQGSILLQSSYFTSEDVNQEAWIYEFLTGKKPNRSIIWKQHNSSRDLFFDDLRGIPSYQKPWREEVINFEAMDKIFNWASKQPEEVQEEVLSFLENPTDRLEETMAFLRERGLIEDITPSPSKSKALTFADIIIRSLPATKDELIQAIQTISPETRRPAATVRQFLRRKTRSGEIIEQEGVYDVVTK